MALNKERTESHAKLKQEVKIKLFLPLYQLPYGLFCFCRLRYTKSKFREMIKHQNNNNTAKKTTINQPINNSNLHSRLASAPS